MEFFPEYQLHTRNKETGKTEVETIDFDGMVVALSNAEYEDENLVVYGVNKSTNPKTGYMDFTLTWVSAHCKTGPSWAEVANAEDY